MSEDSGKPGHKPAQSVANAAALFGADGDDPFAEISSPDTQPAPLVTSTLEPPGAAAAAVQGEQPLASPSELFGTAAGADDWLGGGGAVNAEAPAEWPPAAAAAAAADQQGAAPDAGWPSFEEYAGPEGEQSQQQYSAQGYESQAYHAQPGSEAQYAAYFDEQGQAQPQQYYAGQEGYDASQQYGGYDAQYSAGYYDQQQQYAAYDPAQQQQAYGYDAAAYDPAAQQVGYAPQDQQYAYQPQQTYDAQYAPPVAEQSAYQQPEQYASQAAVSSGGYAYDAPAPPINFAPPPPQQNAYSQQYAAAPPSNPNGYSYDAPAQEYVPQQDYSQQQSYEQYDASATPPSSNGYSYDAPVQQYDAPPVAAAAPSSYAPVHAPGTLPPPPRGPPRAASFTAPPPASALAAAAPELDAEAAPEPSLSEAPQQQQAQEEAPAPWDEPVAEAQPAEEGSGTWDEAATPIQRSQEVSAPWDEPATPVQASPAPWDDPEAAASSDEAAAAAEPAAQEAPAPWDEEPTPEAQQPSEHEDQAAQSPPAAAAADAPVHDDDGTPQASHASSPVLEAQASDEAASREISEEALDPEGGVAQDWSSGVSPALAKLELASETYGAPNSYALPESAPPQSDAGFGEEQRGVEGVYAGDDTLHQQQQQHYGVDEQLYGAGQQYGAEQTYGADQAYGAEQQQYGSEQQSYGGDQTYSGEQTYGAEQGYGGEQQYSGEQQYGAATQQYGAHDQQYGVSEPQQQYGAEEPQYGAGEYQQQQQQSRGLDEAQPSLGAGAYDYSQPNYPAQAASGQAPDAIEERRGVKLAFATFGMGGKLVTFFPGQSVSDAAYGAASSGALTVRQLNSVVSSHAYATALDVTKFPGPILEGPGSANTGGTLARATGGATAGAKAKKAALKTALEQAVAEVERGVGYLRRKNSAVPLTPGEGESPLESNAAEGVAEAQKTEDRVLMMRLLIAMLEHDGNTTNNPAYDSAVRTLLLDGVEKDAPVSLSANSYIGSGSSGDRTLHTYTLQSSFLDRIQELLLAGERREAVRLATQQKMWAHAMTIASCVDKELWRSVVDEFVAHELGDVPQEAECASGAAPVPAPDRQPLRVAYSVFSGQDPSAICDIFRSKTSLTPPQTAVPASVSAQSAPSAAGAAELPRWRQAAATIIANRTAGDSLALTAMGDGLLQAGWVEAAHICYLLSPQTATFDGADGAGARMSLLGAHSPSASSAYLRDLDHILLSEIYEFVGSLRTNSKGTETYCGIPHLQAYRLVHAYYLAEMGDARGAQKYCEAITALLKGGRMSRFYHHTLLAQLQELSDRLTGAPQDAGGNWMTRKMQRPTMNGVWSALEGRFTKFIAGEEGEGAATPGAKKSTGPTSQANGQPGVVGPFSHYSAITPDTTSAGISRAQSTDFGSVGPYGGGYGAGASSYGPYGQSATGSGPSSRAGSAMDFGGSRVISPQPGALQHQSSGVGGLRDPYSDWPQSSQGEPANGSRFGSLQANDSYISDRGSDADYAGPYTTRDVQSSAPWQSSSESGEGRPDEEGFTSGQEPYYGFQTHGGQQPQFYSNVSANGDVGGANGEEGGFISTMDAFGAATPQPSYSPAPMPTAGSRRIEEDVEDDEDLGFGNSSSRKKTESQDAQGGSQKEKPAEKPKPAETAKPELKSSPSLTGAGWLGRIWGRKESGSGGETPKAKKAHLGEENVFYYDKDLKKWVNKKAGDDTSSGTSTPPPPPRAQTASPSMASGGGPHGLGARRSSTDHGGPPPSMSSGYSATGPPSGASTPPPSISEEGHGSGRYGGPPTGPGSLGRGMPPRARSNLGDLSQPPAAQPPLARAASAAALSGAGPPPMSGLAPPSGATPPPPPGGASKKKRPIANRYVRVD